MKTKILFVCLGNICRSPAAEAVFLKLINEEGCASLYEVDSAGTGAWHAGNSADSRMQKSASDRGILINSVARQITINDFLYFDYILTMDNDNFSNVMNLAKQSKVPIKPVVKPLLSYILDKNIKEVPDPYYGGNSGFDIVLDLLEEGCISFLNYLSNKG